MFAVRLDNYIIYDVDICIIVSIGLSKQLIPLNINKTAGLFRVDGG
jgi:hypothetical protein